MEEQVVTEGQATEGVSGESQPTQSGEAVVNNAAETQQQTEAEELVSRLEYNKAREAERKLRSELARYKREFEAAKGGIDFHNKLSQTTPQKLQKIMEIINAQEEAAKADEEDDSWLGEYDPKVANKLREIDQVKKTVNSELLARINQLEQRFKQNDFFAVEQNQKVLESSFDKFLTENKIFPQVTPEIEETPKYKMIQSYVWNSLLERGYGNPRTATMEDFSDVLNDVKAGLTELGKSELIQKARPTVPLSGTRSGQVPSSDKVTEEDKVNLWASFRKELGF